MRRYRQYIVAAFLAAGMILAPAAGMASEQSHRGSTSQSSSRGNSTSSRGSSSTGNHRGSGSSNSGSSSSSNRPTGNTGSSQNRPGGNGNNHGGGSNSGNRPGGGNGNNHGGGSNSGNRPGGNGGNHGGGSNSGNRPGGGGHQPGYNPGSAPRPGAGGGYHPVKPHPPVCSRPDYGYRWGRPLPPPPPRYATVRVGTPSISAILGLTFGSLINYGIDQLLGAGYTVIGTYDNAIYLSNVNRFGVIWPEVTMFYGNAGLNGARFQHSAVTPSAWTYNSAYRNLCEMYGRPVSVTTTGGVRQAVWWGGSNTGYITLSYGPGVNQYGSPLYYTDLIYGM